MGFSIRFGFSFFTNSRRASIANSGIVNSAKTAGSYAKFNNVMKDAYKAFDTAEVQLKAISKMLLYIKRQQECGLLMLQAIAVKLLSI